MNGDDSLFALLCLLVQQHHSIISWNTFNTYVTAFWNSMINMLHISSFSSIQFWVFCLCLTASCSWEMMITYWIYYHSFHDFHNDVLSISFILCDSSSIFSFLFSELNKLILWMMESKQTVYDLLTISFCNHDIYAVKVMY
jgi:hypothetical protein